MRQSTIHHDVLRAISSTFIPVLVPCLLPCFVFLWGFGGWLGLLLRCLPPFSQVLTQVSPPPGFDPFSGNRKKAASGFRSAGLRLLGVACASRPPPPPLSCTSDPGGPFRTRSRGRRAPKQGGQAEGWPLPRGRRIPQELAHPLFLCVVCVPRHKHIRGAVRGPHQIYGGRTRKAYRGPGHTQGCAKVCRFWGWPVSQWKPQPRAEPDGRGEGNEAQAAHQEGTPVRNRQPVVLSYCPSNQTIGTVHTPIGSLTIGSEGTGGGGGEA